MVARDFSLFHPERILWIGLLILGVSFGGGAALFGLLCQEMPELETPLSIKEKDQIKMDEIIFSFYPKEGGISLPLPRVENEITFSSDPPRPGSNNQEVGLFLRCKKSAEVKRISLPCKVPLHYLDGEKLGFSDDSSSLFWLEISQ